MALTPGSVLITKGRSLPAQPDLVANASLWLHSGPWQLSRSFDPAALSAPYALWDGATLSTNLSGDGLRRDHNGITIQFYRQLWHQPPPAVSPNHLWVPSYEIGFDHYHDGPIIGQFGPSPQPDFALPHGPLTYEGPLAPGCEQDGDPLSTQPRHFRGPLAAAVRGWLTPRFAQDTLCEVRVDAADPSPASYKRQVIALVYLKMAGFFEDIAVTWRSDLQAGQAKGFRALARNLGCYVGKAKPPPRPASSLLLSRLLPFTTKASVDATIADFNGISPLVPSAFTHL